jgi:hypothetical protein
VHWQRGALGKLQKLWNDARWGEKYQESLVAVNVVVIVCLIASFARRRAKQRHDGTPDRRRLFELGAPNLEASIKILRASAGL